MKITDVETLARKDLKGVWEAHLSVLHYDVGFEGANTKWAEGRERERKTAVGSW